MTSSLLPGALIILVPLLVIVVVAGLFRDARGRLRVEDVVRTLPVAREAELAAKRRRLVLATAAAMITGIGTCLVAFAWGTSATELLGLPLILAIPAGAITGLLVFNLSWRLAWDDGDTPVRRAEIGTREPWSFGDRASAVMPLLAGGLLIAALLLAGLISGTDESGHHIALPYRGISGWSIEAGQAVDIQYSEQYFKPFPGWFYGVPLIGCIVVLLAGVYLSLRRIAGAPRPPETGLYAADTLLRQRASEFIMHWVSMAFIALMGGLAILSGIGFQSANRETVPSGDADAWPAFVNLQPGYGLGVVLFYLGLALVLLGTVLLVRMIVQLASSTGSIHAHAGGRANA